MGKALAGRFNFADYGKAHVFHGWPSLHPAAAEPSHSILRLAHTFFPTPSLCQRIPESTTIITRLAFATGLLLLAGLAVAQPPATEPMMAIEPAATVRLWEGMPPAAKGDQPQDIPSFAWWPAKESAGATAALVVCPGGGYGALADHEGTDYARWLNSQGISAFVLRYRLVSKGYRHPVMLGDVSRAIRLVRHDAVKFGIDPRRVGVVGSSAGGHLALTACLEGDDGNPESADPIDRQPSRPALAVLCYPVVSMMP